MGSDAFLEQQKIFLHDLATPVSVSLGLVEIVLERLRSSPEVNKKEIERLEKAMGALEKIAKLVESNRGCLIAANSSK